MNLDLNFEARYTGNYAFLVFQLNCILLLKQIRKMSFLFEDKQFFLFSLLEDKQNFKFGGV